jgi:NitT/TauT family transport system substrate-binding protein
MGSIVIAPVLAAGFVFIATTPVNAEVREVRITRQFGLGYLPLMVMEEQKLLERDATAAGLGEIKTTWITLGHGSAAIDALLSNSVDVIATGVTQLVMLSTKTRGDVRGLASLGNAPLHLNTINPNAKSIADLTEKDRIALPAIKTSIEAIVLQMAAAKSFGADKYAQLDRLTVAMKHPDGLIALLSGKSEITAHFTSPPFSQQERKDPRVHTILDSYEVLGGEHTFNVLSAKKSFVEANPKICAALLTALDDAMTFIRKNPGQAAEVYIKVSKTSEPVDKVLEEIKDPRLNYTITPVKVTAFAEFMHTTGVIKRKPESWKDLFFAELLGKREGS